jgi:hypothetical protein
MVLTSGACAGARPRCASSEWRDNGTLVRRRLRTAMPRRARPGPTRRHCRSTTPGTSWCSSSDPSDALCAAPTLWCRRSSSPRPRPCPTSAPSLAAFDMVAGRGGTTLVTTWGRWRGARGELLLHHLLGALTDAVMAARGRSSPTSFGGISGGGVEATLGAVSGGRGNRGLVEKIWSWMGGRELILVRLLFFR